MALTRVERRARNIGLAGVVAAIAAMVVAGLGAPAMAQSQPAPGSDGTTLPQIGKAPGPFKPTTEDAQPDVWIFSGELQNTRETYSGTLVASKDEAQFELKLAGGATCDGSKITGDVGLVRLSEITCSDDRVMRALFVPQGGRELKVFGHVGDERFMANAHLLGTEPVPEPKQTTEPTAPALRGRPGDPDGAPPH